MHSPQDTIAAIATPVGESALGVIRISGSRAIEIVDKFFRPASGESLRHAPSHQAFYGQLYSGKVLDHVIVTLFRNPRTYTGEDLVEISAHGSPFILRHILDECLNRGARLAEPGEFTQRAFLAGKLDLTQAEAVADLISAKTSVAQSAALAQLEGHLATHVRRLRDVIVGLLAHVEVGLDHSDEDHDFIHRQELISGCDTVAAGIDDILRTGRIGKILRSGLRVAILGRPNVGKSSLLNALLKEDRAIVTPIAGTTRDTLEEGLDWDGLPVVLVDTAGLRSNSDDPVEKIGMHRTRQALASADLVLCLLNVGESLSPEDHAVLEDTKAKPHLWVMNKTDLTPAWEKSTLLAIDAHATVIEISALTGKGLDELVRAVKEVASGKEAGHDQAQWMLNIRHQSALEQARTALHQALLAARQETFEECIALELRSALHSLGEIIGETATEDLLGQIFSRFCVGK